MAKNITSIQQITTKPFTTKKRYDRHKFPFLLSKLAIIKSLPDGAAGIL